MLYSKVNWEMQEKKFLAFLNLLFNTVQICENDYVFWIYGLLAIWPSVVLSLKNLDVQNTEQSDHQNLCLKGIPNGPQTM